MKNLILILTLVLVGCSSDNEKQYQQYLTKHHCDIPYRITKENTQSTCISYSRFSPGSTYDCMQTKYTKYYKCDDGYTFTEIN